MNSLKGSTVEGWILDVYPWHGQTVTWMKTRTGEAKRLVDNWQPTFYVAGEMRDLISIARGLNIEGASIEEMYVDPGDSEKSEVLRVPVSSTSEASRLAEMIFSRYRGIRLFNVDVPSNQMYLYTNDIFPYGYAEARCSQASLHWRIDRKSVV